MEEPARSSSAQIAAPRPGSGATGDDQSTASWFSVGVAAVITVLLGSAVVMALDFNDSARQLPMIVGIPTFLLALVATVVEATKVLQGRQGRGHQPWSSSRGAVQVLVVFVGLTVSYLALGFPWGSALFLFGYLWLGARVGLLKSVLVTAGVVAPTYLILVELLETPAFSGLVGS